MIRFINKIKFNRKILPTAHSTPSFITKKRLYEDDINFDELRAYRLERVKKELVKNNLEACILFDPVNVRYALDTVNMSVYNMHNLTRYCFVPLLMVLQFYMSISTVSIYQII